MIIKTILSGPFETNGYLVYDERSNEAVLIDSAPDISETVINEVKKNNLNLKYIINTHGHIDHINENTLLKEKFNAKILIHKSDLLWLNPPEELMEFLPIKLNPSTPDEFLNDGDSVKFGNLEFLVIHTPGHTQGGICLYEKNEKVLFSGDTLFAGTIGRTDFPGGSMEEIIASIKNKLFTLPDDVIVYPGHAEPTTIAEEKKHNPYFN